VSFSDMAAPSVVALVLVISGCGGAGKSTVESASKTQGASTASSPTQSPTARHVSRAQLTAEVNEICRRTEARRAPLRIATAADYATVLPQVAAYQRTMVAELRRLAPPPSFAAGWAQFLTQAGTLASDAARVGEYAQQSNLQAGHRFLEGFATARLKLHAIARRVGFRGCAKF
jgi:hypothetical protein